MRLPGIDRGGAAPVGAAPMPWPINYVRMKLRIAFKSIFCSNHQFSAAIRGNFDPNWTKFVRGVPDSFDIIGSRLVLSA
jgi:hypothetical protein